jgi:hypothetical protein
MPARPPLDEPQRPAAAVDTEPGPAAPPEPAIIPERPKDPDSTSDAAVEDGAPADAAPEPPADAAPDDDTGTLEAAPAPPPERPRNLALIAVLVYVLVRALGLAILWWYAYPGGGLARVTTEASQPIDADFLWMLAGRYDAVWYQQIATDGYASALEVSDEGQLLPTNLAFFPLLPGLIALLTAITPMSPALAGVVVAAAAGLAAAWGLYAIGAHVHSPAAGVMLAGIWGALPHAIVQNLAYTESLFTALVAWTLYAVLRRNWVTAGLLCLVAGLARPTATALIAAVGIAALVAVLRQGGWRPAVFRRDGWRPWVAMLLAPLGYLGYLWWVGDRLGRLDAYVHFQREAWRIYFDGGAETVEIVRQTLTGPLRLAFYGVTVMLLLGVLLFAVSLVMRQPLPLVVYSAATLVIVLGTAGGFHGKGRYMLPAVPLFLPLAAGLARAWVPIRVLVLLILAAVSGWYGAYLTLEWTLSP